MKNYKWKLLVLNRYVEQCQLGYWVSFFWGPKGQLISERNLCVFKSPKKPTKFLTDFCPMKIGQKSFKNLVGFLGDLKTPIFYSEINLTIKSFLKASFFFFFRSYVHQNTKKCSLRKDKQPHGLSDRITEI